MSHADLRKHVEENRTSRIRAYHVAPRDIREHYCIEQVVLAGGYGYRQLLELVQNGADAIIEAQEKGLPVGDGQRLQVVLRDSYLYVANTGAPLTADGLDALLSSHSSTKQGNEIGRFGLGFKSLLRLNGRIDFFTRASGDIRFDPDRCRGDLQKEFHVTEVPGLRLAWPLDEAERETDPIIRSLTWAETVVRVELKATNIVGHLRSELRTFPSEFLLFLPFSVTLQLDDGDGLNLVLRVERTGDECVLFAGETQSRWRVVARQIKINDERARLDATHIHARETVPLTWAIPLEPLRDEAGRFWAFFPTQTQTRVPGILNAPWKVNSDRDAVIGGEWNTALMAQAASLIVDTLPQLRTDDDPGRPLDMFPQDGKGEIAVPLVEAVWKALETVAVIPDASGTPRSARELLRHPRDNAELARKWQALAPDVYLKRLVHPSCVGKPRGERLEVLAERIEKQKREQTSCDGLQAIEAKSWFAVVASVDLPQACEVLKLAEAYFRDCYPDQWTSVRPQLAIIPSESGQLRTASQVVFAPDGATVPDGRYPVARALWEDADSKRILTELLRIENLDDRVWESAITEALGNACGRPPDEHWRSFWAMLRLAPETFRKTFVRHYHPYPDKYRVRRRDGRWVRIDEVLQPGKLIRPDDASTHRGVLVDSDFHRDDTSLLTEIGLVECPGGTTTDVKNEELQELGEWYQDCRDQYAREHAGARTTNLGFWPNIQMPNGWRFLAALQGIPNAILTEMFLVRCGQGEFRQRPRFGRIGRTGSFTTGSPTIDVPHPLPWFLLKYGSLRVGDSTVRLSAVVARSDEPALLEMAKWDQHQAAFKTLHSSRPVSPKKEDIRDLWLALIKAMATPVAVRDDSLRTLWTGAAKDGVLPESLRREDGVVPLTEVFVTTSTDLAQRARKGRARHVVVTLDEQTFNLWLENGARNLAQVMRPEYTEASPKALLLETLPEIGEILKKDAKKTAVCQAVSGLRLVIGEDAEPRPCLMWESVLFFDFGQLGSLSRADRYQRLLTEVAGAGWLGCTPDEALHKLGDGKVDELRAKVKQGLTLPEKLLRAVGGHPEPLKRALGDLDGMGFIQQCDLFQLAELTLAQLGPSTLTTLAGTLKDEGLNPPSRWGTSEARDFVASIGFSEEFAASPKSRRESEELINGPIPLPELHDFQKEVLEDIARLVASGTGRRRAVVCLPTGGGKTRVTVQATVELVLRPPGNCRSAVWVAQTDELCEQAVQAFRQVWLNCGAQGTDLRMVRLWGGNPNPTIQEPDKPIVIVASIQTLNLRMGGEDLAWLRRPGMVVVDECHHGITSSYTNLLRWLDAEAARHANPEGDEPPIIGLSATPFRANDTESDRLARRFDNRWFPSDQEHLFIRLSRQGVLAEVVLEDLKSGMDLLDDEVAQLSTLRDKRDGIDFERLLEKINRRIGSDERRNERLVDLIRRADERSILFFANSVLHAQEMSARLNLEGIPSAAVSGDTPSVARRYFLDRFQRGEIRVLCNHSVLTTGFDAPKTDMVLIARQVFSPVRYMQMVGRGLRGVANGGKPRCRIVTVLDNLHQFEEKHPYHYCRWYFEEISRRAYEQQPGGNG